MSHPQVATPTRSKGVSASTAQPATWAIAILFIEWVLVFYDVDYYLVSFFGMRGVFGRIRLVLLIPLILSVFLYGKPRDIYWPLALFTLFHLLHVPFTPNRGYAMTGFNRMFVIFVLFTSTLTLIRTPSRFLNLYNLFLLSFPWFMLHGLPTGQVVWHSELRTRDAYGPLGVIAMGFGYFTYLGYQPKVWRRGTLAIAIGGLLAMVVSMARGAFLSAVVVGGAIWLRSRRKVAALAAGIVGIGLMFVAAEIVYPGGAFWDEMATIQDGNTEGTGGSRWSMWVDMAWPIFLANPIFGVGANCVGIVGTDFISEDVLPGKYSNPATLYSRPLHNIYFQLLSEQGLVGTGIWAFMLFDLWGRLRRLRKPAARAKWSRAVQGRIDLFYISLALEAATLGFLVNAFFYNQLYRHWFYDYALFAILLERITQRSSDGGERRGTVAARADPDPSCVLEVNAEATAAADKPTLGNTLLGDPVQHSRKSGDLP